MGYSHAQQLRNQYRSKQILLAETSRHPAPNSPQPTLSERETPARQRLQTTFETYVFNTLPTHLIRVTDMTLVTRNRMWETFKPRIESLSDSHIAKLLLEQDEEARKLGVSVADPEVLAPFVSSWFTSHCRGKGLCWGIQGKQGMGGHEELRGARLESRRSSRVCTAVAAHTTTKEDGLRETSAYG